VAAQFVQHRLGAFGERSLPVGDLGQVESRGFCHDRFTEPRGLSNVPGRPRATAPSLDLTERPPLYYPAVETPTRFP
jgi:hypothetical protein